MATNCSTCREANKQWFEYILQSHKLNKKYRFIIGRSNNLAYLTKQLLNLRGTVQISIIIEVFHYPIVFCLQFLVPGIVTAAEVFIHLTELKLLLWLKGGFKIQTLWMQERRCDPKRQQIKQNKRRLPYTAENIAKVPHNAQIQLQINGSSYAMARIARRVSSLPYVM